MNISTVQIEAVRKLLATKTGKLNKQRDYTVGALHELILGYKLKPLHLGRPMNKLYQYAIDIAKILELDVKLVGSMDDWISMKSYDVYYILAGTSKVKFTVVDLLNVCSISYDEDFLKGALMTIKPLDKS